MDLARRSPEYMRELARHHVGGHLKVAPEHTDPERADEDAQAGNDDFEQVHRGVQSRVEAGGQKQFHRAVLHRQPPGQRPGLDDPPGRVPQAQTGYRPDQVQDFIPAPFDVATCDVLHRHRPVHQKASLQVAKHLRDRKLQRALMQFFKPENYFEVRKALLAAGRGKT